MRRFFLALAATFAGFGMLFAPLAVAQDDVTGLRPLEVHFHHMLQGSGQWRTPADDIDPGDPNAVVQFGSDYTLAPDRSHVIAQIIGLTEDGRRAVYWTIYFFYNPVTDEVVSAQTGWSGAYLEGREPVLEAPLASGDAHIFDQTHYLPDGTASVHRHEVVVVDDRTHTTQTYSQTEAGDWEPNNFRTWTRVPGD